ncbi:MAG: prepilin-type N-terminal cleavage/methylation domain-containing protein [Elusimicrobiaceae bacterium]|nr:prepilin-type N-terminal cleavage/methylation domain-containing protein [Elusimicrobiaceae bacterium]
MNKKGFSLMEMLTVVIIVGLLSSIALPQYRKIMEKGRFTKAQVMAKSLHDSCERLMEEYGVENYTDLPPMKQTITALDVVGPDVLPVGFTLLNMQRISGKGFGYYLVGNCNVYIQKIEGNYKAKFLFTGEEFTCEDIDTDACNVYGLD